MTDTDSGTPAPESGEPTTTPPAGTDGVDIGKLQADVEKWKAMSRENEKKLTAATKALDAKNRESMSDTEKAVAEARAEARTETLREVGGRLAAAAIRVAAAGRSVDVDALIEGVDATRFLDDQGEPDAKAIQAWVDRVAPQAAPAKRDLGVGPRGQSGDTPIGDDNNLLRDLKRAVGAE